MTTYNSPFSGDVIQPTDVSYQRYYLTASINLYWPINGVPATYDVAARIMDISASANGFSITMPPANQASVGQDALFNNTGAYDIDVIDYSSGAITTVLAGKSSYIYITYNANTAGTWGVIDFGTTTSSNNAATLAGFGLLAISNTLNQSHPTQAILDGSTFSASNRAQTMIWGGGAGSVTLDSATSIGDNWFILLKNNGSGTLTVNCSGSDFIDLQSNKTFQPNESALIVCDGSGYVTIGYGTSSTFFFSALTKALAAGTYVLTTSEAQSIIQEYVGTLTGDVVVVYPPVVALYVISNQVVDNGHTLTVTTGIGGASTVLVPPGQQVSLICDGVNFYNANTVQAGSTVVSLNNGTVGTPSLNFASETSTGIYRIAAGNMGVAVLGVNIATFNSSGLTIAGTITATNYANISGGAF
jgi:hypothetical protein